MYIVITHFTSSRIYLFQIAVYGYSCWVISDQDCVKCMRTLRHLTLFVYIFKAEKTWFYRKINSQKWVAHVVSTIFN